MCKPVNRLVSRLWRWIAWGSREMMKERFLAGMEVPFTKVEKRKRKCAWRWCRGDLEFGWGLLDLRGPLSPPRCATQLADGSGAQGGKSRPAQGYVVRA